MYEIQENCYTIPDIPKLFCCVNAKKYLLIGCGFDIETTKIEKNSYMYHWQMSYGNTVFLGRTWDSFIDLIYKIKEKLKLKKNERVLMYIANLSFEFQFLRKRFKITDIMAKAKRNPIMLEIDGFIEVRDALAITGTNLATLAKNYCTTKKLVGDLDYSIKRNSKSYMNENEKNYCINDVVILKEFSEYIFDLYGQQHFLPLTKTGILRNIVKNKSKEYYKPNVLKRKIFELFPKTKDEYNYIMRYLFKGGYVHGVANYTGEIITDLESWDKKSSYPSSEIAEFYPVTPFKKFDVSLFDDYVKKYNVIFIAEFTNLSTKTNHSIFSQHKSIINGKKIIDNGRIAYAEKCELFLCEVELEELNNFYKYDKMEIKYCAYAKKGKLPSYLILPMIDAYIKKEEIAKNGGKDTADYANQKSYLNSNFGMCVTRLKFNDYYIDENGNVELEETEKTYYEAIKNSILSPFWGIYITAYSRSDLLRFLYNTDSYYCDTDSGKIQKGKYEKYIKKHNAEIRKKVMKGCEHYGIDYEKIKGLGEYQKEYNIKRLKYLGCKRYLIEKENGEIESTISGLKKGVVKTYADYLKKDAFEIFTNEMCIPKDFTKKLIPSYNDEYHSDNVDGELMEEYSSVTLCESDFNLKMNDDYIMLIEYLKNKVEKGILQ